MKKKYKKIISFVSVAILILLVHISFMFHFSKNSPYCFFSKKDEQ